MIYWPVLFAHCPRVPAPFRRAAGDRSAAPPNNLLDYGYAALRAAMELDTSSRVLLIGSGLTADEVLLRLDTLEVEARQIVVTIRPASLWRGRLRVESLTIAGLRLTPLRHSTDGFFAAVWEKR